MWGGALGAETLCLSGVKICPWNTLGGNLGGQVENVCPLGAEKRAEPAKFCIEVKQYNKINAPPHSSIQSPN